MVGIGNNLIQAMKFRGAKKSFICAKLDLEISGLALLVQCNVIYIVASFVDAAKLFGLDTVKVLRTITVQRPAR